MNYEGEGLVCEGEEQDIQYISGDPENQEE